MEKIYNVCICTYLRPKSLRRCLEALSKQLVNHHGRVFELTIIDNDVHESAKANALSFNSDVFQTIRYTTEARRGIPFARNHAIDTSLSAGSDFLIFIDDDEEPSLDWLEQLCSFSEQDHGKAIVHGGVVDRLPQDTPTAIRSLFGKKGSRPTGAEMHTCATDNVLVPRAAFDQSGLRFDTSEPLAGGTDTLFFSLARRTGYTIKCCNEAQVTAHIHPSRACLSWLMKRKFRAGITDFKRKRNDGKSTLYLLLASALHTCLHSLATLLYTVTLNKANQYKSLLHLSRSCGRLWSFWGGTYNAYQTVDNSG